jgi:GTP-binding protein
VDGHAGLSPVDRDTVRLLERSGKPVFLVVNKIDGPARDGLVHDFHALGVDRLYPVSSAHNRGIDELLDDVVAALPAGVAAAPDAATKLALVGRPNVGKSSLLNRLLGTERALVSPRPGTTRDATDTPVVANGRPYVLIDTAGIRRRSRVEDQLERHGAVRALGMLERADVALVVLDATEGMTDQDARIVGRALQAGRGVVLLANKWDLVKGAERDVKRFRERVRGLNPGFADLPILCVSAESGEGLDALFNQVERVEVGYRTAVGTPVLNRTLAAAVAAHQPPSVHGGRAVRLYYATPPAFTIFTNAPGSIPPDYTRYLARRFSDAFGIVGVPIRIAYRPRRAPESAEAASARPRRGSASRTRRSSKPTSGSGRARRR